MTGPVSRFAFAAFTTCLMAAAACNGSHRTTDTTSPHREDGALDEATSLAVSPASATIKVADAAQSNPGLQQFTATLPGTGDTRVAWEICQGSTCFAPDTWNQFGAISPGGLFKAPLVLPNPPTFQVRATSVVDPTKTATATVTIDRNVQWSVTTGPDIAGPTPDWAAMMTPGDHEVFYHVLHDGEQEICQPSTTDPAVGRCYRQVIFHVGTGYRPGNGAVFFFHGAGGHISGCSEWNVENDRHGWITVCIQGVAHGAFGPPNKSRSWNALWAARHGTPAPQLVVPDDSALAWAIADDLVNHLSISPRRIHAAGQSAGDLMLVRLVVENGAQIASIAQGPGNMYGTDHAVCFGDDEPCNPPSRFPQVHAFPPFGFGIPHMNYPVSVIMIMGTADKPTPLCGSHNNSPNIDEDFRIYADSFHCATRGPNDNPFCPYVPDQSPRCQQSKFVPGSGRACAPGDEVYKHARDCDSGVVVSAYSLVNGVHSWALTDISNPDNIIHNRQLKTDFPNSTPPNGSGSQHAIVWDFFNRHPKP